MSLWLPCFSYLLNTHSETKTNRYLSVPLCWERLVLFRQILTKARGPNCAPAEHFCYTSKERLSVSSPPLPVYFHHSITSYQTLPRNMPSHRVPFVPHYDDGYRSMPRNSMAQRDSICSMSPSMYDQALGPLSSDKRRSMRDDTMWQLYEWQQRQAYVRQPAGLYGNMLSPKTMFNLSDHAAPSHSIPPSPSHGSLSMYGGYSPMRSYNMTSGRSEVASPMYRRDMSIDRRHRAQVTKVSQGTYVNAEA